MSNPALLARLRDSLTFSFTLSIGLHIVILYFIGSWVIDLGKTLFIHDFLITEIRLEDKSNPKAISQEVKQSQQNLK